MAEPYDAVYFIDNDQSYIDQVRSCPKITIEKVPGIEGDPPFVPMLTDAEFISKLSDDAQNAMKFFTHRDGGNDMYDKISGIRYNHISKILSWASTTEGKKAILIDFDRTITLFEGMMLHKNILFKDSYPQPQLSHLTPDGYIEYLVGGIDRLSMLQYLFSTLYTLGVDIFILTNSMSYISNSIGFNELIQIISKGGPVEIISSRMFGSNKYHAIMADSRFARVCASEGGKRKTRKNKKRNTRRRCKSGRPRRHMGVPSSRHAARRL
jgi:hypothetical protein